MDSSNQFAVCKLSEEATLIAGKLALAYDSTKGGYVLTNARALNLAAWLANIADPEGKEFDRLREEIKKP